MGSLRSHPSSHGMILFAAAALFCGSAVYARPQDDTNQSLAEAARKAKERKKKPDKPVKTITEDDIAALRAAAVARGEAAPERGTAPEQPDGKAKEGGSERATAEAPTQEEIAKREAELKKLKDDLKDAEKDLNLLQRDFALQSEQFYSKPDFNRDTDGKAKLDDMQKQIGDKQQDIDRLKTRVAALQELIDRAKAARGDTVPPAQPAPPPAPPAGPGL